LNTRKKFLILSSSALAAAAIAGSAFAADGVTATVTAGTKTASVADLALPAADYAHTDQTNAGTMVLTADDSTGSGAGWNVTIQSSAFVYSGANAGADIPAANFSLSSAGTPVATAGQAVDATDGPMVPTTSPVGTLDTARKTLQADAAFGQGTYTQDLGVALTIPADSRAGTYTGTLTTTIAAAP
jgi:hypothetical protein